VTHRRRLCHFVIDCPDLDAATAFWVAALDATEEHLADPSTTRQRLYVRRAGSSRPEPARSKHPALFQVAERDTLTVEAQTDNV
jgi:hypothetical protein